MNWAVLLGGAALGAWLLLKEKPEAEIRSPEDRPKLLPPPPPPASKAWRISSVPAAAPAKPAPPSFATNTGDYLVHLENAVRRVDLIDAGAETHEQSEEVNEAWAELGLPIDTLTAQKDLNVLGAQPPLVEDGVYGPKTRDAIVSFQKAMDIAPTGEMNFDTNHALRRAVAHVLSQGGTSP